MLEPITCAVARVPSHLQRLQMNKNVDKRRTGWDNLSENASIDRLSKGDKKRDCHLSTSFHFPEFVQWRKDNVRRLVHFFHLDLARREEPRREGGWWEEIFENYWPDNFFKVQRRSFFKGNSQKDINFTSLEKTIFFVGIFWRSIKSESKISLQLAPSFSTCDEKCPLRPYFRYLGYFSFISVLKLCIFRY